VIEQKKLAKWVPNSSRREIWLELKLRGLTRRIEELVKVGNNAVHYFRD